MPQSAALFAGKVVKKTLGKIQGKQGTNRAPLEWPRPSGRAYLSPVENKNQQSSTINLF
jgi:hypothetical protein